MNIIDLRLIRDTFIEEISTLNLQLHEFLNIFFYENKHFLKRKTKKNYIEELKKINDPIVIKKKIKELKDQINSSTRFSTLEKSIFVYSHSIFEKSLNKLLELSISLDDDIYRKYIELLSRKEENNIINKKNERFFDSSYHLIKNYEEKKIKLIQHLNEVLKDNPIEIGKNFFDIKNNKRFQYICRWYYEAKERRNLLVHRSNKIDHIYINKIRAKKINLEDDINKISPKKLDVGIPVFINPFYYQNFIKNIITIFFRIYFHVIQSSSMRKQLSSKLEIPENNLATIQLSDLMHQLLSLNSKFKEKAKKYASNELKDNLFIKEFNSYNLSADLIYEIIKEDFAIDEDNIFLLTNYLITYKRIYKPKKIFFSKYKNHYEKSNLLKAIFQILIDDHNKAFKMLEAATDNDELDSDAFYEWEIFDEIRNSKKFSDIYRRKFNENFKIL